ncbi:hypothetical protein QTP88_005970 [Uroleucon formosanum]
MDAKDDYIGSQTPTYRKFPRGFGAVFLNPVVTGDETLDLVPYHLFTNLKKHIGGKRLNSDEEVKTVMMEYLEKKVNGGFYDADIQKLLDGLQKYLDMNSDYVEK